MAEINAKDVMALRNRTGLAMMECKKALAEADGDPEKAEELLRKKLKGKMDTRADRAAGEGRIAVAIGSGAATIVELRAETDFTAKNDQFIATAQKVADLALAASATGAIEPTDEMKAAVDNIRIATGENISLARIERHAASTFGSYVHHDGKTGVLIAIEGDLDTDIARKIGMHIVAATPRPVGVSPNDIPAAVVEKERRFRIEQAMESGKPQEIAEKMVEGGMRKFYEEIALLEQKFVMDESKAIKDLVGKASITLFRRWEVGEEAHAPAATA